MTDRFVEIVQRRLPVGWRIEVWGGSKQYRALCDFKLKTIYIPPLDSRRDLFVALHEVGHATLHHQNQMAPHVQEYEAEQFAILAMRFERVPVPRIELALARANVREAIRVDHERGHWKIDPAIKKWSRT